MSGGVKYKYTRPLVYESDYHSTNPIRNTRSWFSAHQTVNYNPWWFNFIKVTLEQYVSENWKLHGYVNVTTKYQHSFVRRPQAASVTCETPYHSHLERKKR